jgi:hypothetical protein
MPMMHHNNFVSSVEYQQSFSAIFDDLSLPRLPSFYINCPSRPALARSAMPTSVANAHASQGRMRRQRRRERTRGWCWYRSATSPSTASLR